jgi:hypothetical protein
MTPSRRSHCRIAKIVVIRIFALQRWSIAKNKITPRVAKASRKPRKSRKIGSFTGTAEGKSKSLMPTA